jgi:hypothetical protein
MRATTERVPHVSPDSDAATDAATEFGLVMPVIAPEVTVTQFA